MICGKKRIDGLINIVNDLVRLNDEIYDIEIDLDCEKYSSVLLLRKQRDGVIGAVEKQIGELICGKKRIYGLINIVNDLVHLNDEIYDIEIDLDCEKPYSEEYSSVLWLRKQRDGVIGVLEKQIGELIYKEKRIDGLINIVNDLVHLNDEIYDIEMDLDCEKPNIEMDSDYDIEKPIHIQI